MGLFDALVPKILLCGPFGHDWVYYERYRVCDICGSKESL